jgi:hypothetical protein
MKALISPYFGKFLAEDIKKQFSNDANVYIGIGRSVEFGSSVTDVDPVLYSTIDINSIYRNLIGLKKIQSSDMQLVVARRDWASGITYDQYEDHVNMFNYIDINNIGTANANANTTLAGTVNITASNVVVGSGTSFSNYIFPGDQIAVNLATKTVVSVTNNDHLVVSSNFANTNTGGSIVLVKNTKTLVANSADFTARSVGDVVRINTDDREIVAIRSSKVISLNAALTYSNSNITVSTVSNTYPLTANNFYIRNSRDQVFKCIFDNNNAVSTVEPTIDIDGQLPESPFILTGDGYKWKYLYTIPSGLKQKFFNQKWMPVITDQAVVAGSVDGAIDIIEVLWGGSGHVAGGNSNTARIISVTGTDGANANLIARVESGVITGVTILAGGNNYTLGTVEVDDNDKLGTVTLPGTVNVSGSIVTANLSNNPYFLANVFPNDIVTVNAESRNVVTVSSTQLSLNAAVNSAACTQTAVITRSNAEFNIQFSPHGGHGSNPFEELGCHTLMISTELVRSENETIPVSQVAQLFDFNQVSIIQDPIYRFANNTTRYANSNNLRATTRLFVADPGVSNFVQDETVYVGSTVINASGVANVAHWDPNDNFLYINNITGTFAVQEAIKGESSGISIPIIEIANSEIKPFSGTLLYTENRKNVVRLDNQIDQIKVILSF